MGNRLTKIYTKTGDSGETGLGDGSRVAKNNLRVCCYGDIDELNSCIGVAICETNNHDISVLLTHIQHDLFDLGGEFCIPNHSIISESHVKNLEVLLDKYNLELKPLKDFILPGGSKLSAYLHLARTICRRCERSAINLHKKEPVNSFALQYLNRLSDFLFVAARFANKETGDVLWSRDRV